MTPLSLSIENVRSITGIGRTRLYEAINNGKLKARKFGKRTIILRDDLDIFLTNLESYPMNKRGSK